MRERELKLGADLPLEFEGALLLWLNEHNHGVLFYAVSLFGAAVMWFHGWFCRQQIKNERSLPRLLRQRKFILVGCTG